MSGTDEQTSRVTAECNGICLSASDIGVGEYGDMIAYAHPDCPEHGDPLEDDPAAEICGGGDESQRYVREEDVRGVDTTLEAEQ
ncbi:hypothetical protein [Streptomyces sp. S1D4-14]|uniref:hypothetical protein n=1 Tax=Streptomyces sp. S1D4-14 TaxID=2594461 RepID=UPI0011635F44|nr:hypothetical protein [Streptomyces sp. S1D4-14]QDN64396.1 hypothetical protein FNV66_00765 [Streptomyces sp. S1D4-14]